MKLETEKELEYKSTIMEMRNIIKNQERVIEELMLNSLNIQIENEEVAEVAQVAHVAKVAQVAELVVKSKTD